MNYSNKNARLLTVASAIIFFFLQSAIDFQRNSAQASLPDRTAKQISILETDRQLALTVSSDREQAIESVKLGIESHESQPELALLYYLQAITIDPQFGYGYLGAAMIVGHTDEGIKMMKIAKELFHHEGDIKGYNLAKAWLLLE